MLTWGDGAVFFFASRRRHTRFDCDWSSDVCSSDLRVARELVGGLHRRAPARPGGQAPEAQDPRTLLEGDGPPDIGDRKSVVEGKRVDLGGRRIIKKKKR